MQVRHLASGQIFTLFRTESDSTLSLRSPSGDEVSQDVVAGTALLTDADGAVVACSDPQLAAEFEEVISD